MFRNTIDKEVKATKTPLVGCDNDHRRLATMELPVQEEVLFV